MDKSDRTKRILALSESIQSKINELRDLLCEDARSQKLVTHDNNPFNCNLGVYIGRKRLTHSYKIRGLPLFCSVMKKGWEIYPTDSGLENKVSFRDVPMKDFMLIPKSCLLKYRRVGEKSISVLKEIVLEDGGRPHSSW
jgi:hypothetical protein